MKTEFTIEFINGAVWRHNRPIDMNTIMKSGLFDAIGRNWAEAPLLSIAIEQEIDILPVNARHNIVKLRLFPCTYVTNIPTIIFVWLKMYNILYTIRSYCPRSNAARSTN